MEGNKDFVFLITLTAGCVFVGWWLTDLVGEELGVGLSLLLWFVGFGLYNRD